MAKRSPRLTFTQRILAALVAVVVSSAIVGSYILVSVRALEDLALAEIRAHDAASAARALEMQSVQYGLALRQYIDTRNATHLQHMDAYVRALLERRETLLELTTVESTRRVAASHVDLSARRRALADSVVALVSAGSMVGFDSLMARYERAETAVNGALTSMIDIERVASAEARAARQASHRTFERNVMLAIAIAVFVISTLLYSVVLGHVTQRVRQLTRMASRVAAGDYSPDDEAIGPNDELTVLARTFNEMASQLAAFDKVKEEFVALAAHQLRTPAAGVKGNLGMLIEGYCGPLTAEQMDVVQDADACNERQLALISDLLVVARTDSGRLLLSRAPAGLGPMLDQVVEDHRPRASARGHTLTLERPPEDMVIDMDAQKMRMVVDNLVENAIKYTPDGGRVTVVASSGGNGVVEFSVSDTGVGISEEDQAKVFRKFARLPNPMSEKVGGTGLGLYLAHEIVKLHGGRIRLDSTPGEGTTFTVSLPKESGA
ncbi:MAG: ATP-binding protein [Gemmatimonadales bacterium]